MAANAILAISSTDRYLTNLGGNVNQPVSNTLLAQYQAIGPYSNDFSITAPNALMNGYIDKIIISQIQIQYYLPTIIPGRNDTIVVNVETGTGTGTYVQYEFGIPYGFFTPDELAAMLQIFLNTQVYGSPGAGFFTVTYNQGNTGAIAPVGFSVVLDDLGKRFWFPSPAELVPQYPGQFPDEVITSLLRAYRVFGFNLTNAEPNDEQISYNAPEFLYTPFIDIYSDALTNYQKLKDTDSSVSRRKGLIARIYLSGIGSPNLTNGPEALGSAPFVLTYDLSSPKIINWTPDTAVNSLDFQLRDSYGDLLFVKSSNAFLGNEVFNTEFQMTLLCIEGS